MTPTCYPSLELSSAWTTQADSPGPHGTCPLAIGTATTPLKVIFTPAKRDKGKPWDNVYILHRNAYTDAMLFAYVTSITFPTAADIANCNAYEQDFQINDGKSIFNWGWQFLIGTGLRIWDRANARWTPTPVMQFKPFTAGQPLRIAFMFSRTLSQVSYLGAALDGVYAPINISFPAVNEAQHPYINNAVQLDSKGQGAPIALWLNECNVVGF